MIKRLVIVQVLFTIISVPLFPQHTKSVVEAFEAVFSAVPDSYSYHEKSGALMINQYKDYSYEIITDASGPLSRVTYSSTQNKKPSSEDPRPVVKEGDTSPLNMRALLDIIDIFDDPSARLVYTGIKSQGGERFSVYDVFYNRIDNDGRTWPMEGRLYLDSSSGTPLRLEGEQTRLPDDLYSLCVEADFTGKEPDTCRVSDYKVAYTGQYGIFRYHCEESKSFSYR